jgi:hypothetical protein
MYSIISNAAITLCFLPFLMVFWKNLFREKSFLVIAIYWMASGLINLPNWLGQADNNRLQHEITILYDLLDAPLVLLFFFYSSSGNKKKIVGYILAAVVFLELLIVMLKGYNLGACTIIVAIDTFLALTLSIAGISEYLGKLEHTPSENTLVFFNAALLFSYGVFIIIYFFSYLNIATTKNERDQVFLIYYICLFLSTALTCYGIWRYSKKSLFEETFGHS